MNKLPCPLATDETWVTHVALCLNSDTLDSIYAALNKQCQAMSADYKATYEAMEGGYPADRKVRAAFHHKLQAWKPALRLVRAMRSQERNQTPTRLPFKTLPLFLLGQADLLPIPFNMLSAKASSFERTQALKRFGCSAREGRRLMDFLSQSFPEVFPPYGAAQTARAKNAEQLRSETAVALVLAKIATSNLLSSQEFRTLQSALK